MVILHITSITNNKASGISNVVPQHVLYQQKFENVGILNCNDIDIIQLKNAKNVFKLSKIKNKNISYLPEPFNKPDIVIFHGIYIIEYIKLAKYILKKNIPYIIVPHGSLTNNAQQIKRYKKIIANFILFNKFVEDAKAIQFLSQNEKQQSQKFKIRESFVSGNGMEIFNIKPKNFHNMKKIKFIYIGRIAIYHKGLDLLIKAINLVNKKKLGEQIEFYIYGPTNNETYKLKRMIKKYNIQNIVKLENALYDDEKKEILSEPSIFIQTSRLEGQPLGIMEAMAYGLPCLVTNGTTFGKIIEENNCGYSSSEDEEKIAENILKILENRSNLEKFSYNAYNYAKKYFDWNYIAKKTIENYNKFVEDR